MNGDLALFTPAALAEVFLTHGDLGIIGLDAAGQVILWNSWIAGRTGIAAETATGRRLPDLFDPPPARLWATVQTALTLGQPRVLSPVLHANWLPFTIPARQLIRLLPVSGASDAPAGLLMLVSDVTVQMQYEEQAEANLLESAERYRAFFENSLDAILLMSPDGSTQAANPAACQMFGRTAAEIIQAGRLGLVDARDPNLARLLAERARTGHVRGELTMLRRDGTPFPVEMSSALFRDAAGSARTSMIIRDITGRRQAEETLRRQRNNLSALLEISQALATTLDLAAVLQMIVERAAGLIELDSGALYLLEATELHLGATTPPLPPEFPDAFRRAARADHPHIHMALAAGRPITVADAAAADLSPAERAIITARGLRSLLYLPLTIETRPVGILILGTVGRTRPFAADEIDLYGALAVQAALAIENARLYAQVRRQAAELEQRVAERTTELSERVVEVEQLNRAMTSLLEDLQAAHRQATEAAEQLKAVNAELGAFTYSVSHDLKAPLRGIDGYSRLLLEDYTDRLDADGRQFLHNIRRAAGQMSQLIDDLLAYSRLERRAVNRGPVNLAALAAAVVAERQEELRDRGVQLTMDAPCAPAMGEVEGVAQALRNLLDNALKFTRDTANATITIGGRETETSCILWVADNGPGFDMKYHDRIFEIFQRLHRPEEYPGTGIGLAIVRKAMQRMGGRAWAESAPGQGATFYLEIPK